LVDNAIRHTPGNGRIDLAVGREGQCAMFEICDSGPGIPEADLSRIFEPFFRGSRSVGDGTGLGLSIVQRICERLNGTVAVENVGSASEPKGLRVCVRLALAG